MKRKTVLSIIALIALLAMTLFSSTGVGAQPLPTVYFMPGDQTIHIGDTAVVEVWVDNVLDFYGVEFEVSFDEIIVQGIDVVPGAAFDPYPGEHEVLESSISGGVAYFAATLLRVAKAPPLSGNLHLATITFTGVNYGTSPLAWPEIKLADSYGDAILYEYFDGSITVEAERGSMTGRAFLEGRDEHGGIAVEMSNSEFYATTTDVDGWYEFVDVIAETYNVYFSHELYLTTVVEGCTVNPGETAWMPDITLLGGDLNGDGVIDISDLVIGAANFNTGDPMSDINGDGLVDIFDIVLIGKNFGLTGPIIEMCVP
ncbi:MAG: hypothetical protein JW934_22870 [Anaerolineae bacterium]|nr:hypothetical protein [Anaerolineae bacterium]